MPHLCNPKNRLLRHLYDNRDENFLVNKLQLPIAKSLLQKRVKIKIFYIIKNQPESS